MAKHINNYFVKLEDCNRIAEALKQPITDNNMVLMLVEYRGIIGTLTRSTVKFEQQKKVDKTWAKSKEYC